MVPAHVRMGSVLVKAKAWVSIGVRTDLVEDVIGHMGVHRCQRVVKQH